MNQTELIKTLHDHIPNCTVMGRDSLPDQFTHSGTGISATPIALVQPESQLDAQKIVIWANTNRIKLHAISTGRNWGYGNSLLNESGDYVILDLSKLNKIKNISIKYHSATIETGVTQGQLSEHLKKNGDHLWLDCTGAGPDTSILANLLERGFGHSEFSDKLTHSFSYKVLLATGEIIDSTDIGSQNRMHGKFKYIPGPSLDGLFIQSNFGIVLEATISLIPKPSYIGVLAFQIKNDKNFFSLIDKLQTLKSKGLVQGSIHIANDLRVLSSKTRRPKEYGQALGAGDVQKLRSKFGVSPWSGVGAYYGTKEGFRAYKKSIKQATSSDASLIFFSQFMIKLIRRLQRFFEGRAMTSSVGQKVKSLVSVLDLLEGIPSKEHLDGVYWPLKEIKDTSNLTPFHDRVGLYWVSPMMPFDSSDVSECLKVVGDIYKTYNFDLMVTFSLLNSRCIQGIFSINFDAGCNEQKKNAKKCYDEVNHAFFEYGFLPYRLNSLNMHHMESKDSPYLRLRKSLKSHLDPQGTISPGRYGF